MRKGQQDLYDSRFEHDNCGIGFVANLKNKKSNQIIQDALRMLERMEHRGAVGAEPNSGDGAGILIQKPHKLFLTKAVKLGFSLPNFEDYGVAQVFFPGDKRQAACKDILEKAIAKFNFKLLGYRVLPKDNKFLGFTSGSCEPDIIQVFIEKPSNISLETFERQLFVIRNYTSHQVKKHVENTEDDFYIATCSYKTIAYKGQFTTEQVGQYFHDLNEPDCETALAVVHSRFSTNTFPKWKLAQPFRYIAHNGEINTVRGNVNWFKSREAIFKSTKFTEEELDMIMPICDHSQSDSANLDNAVEMLALSGRSLPHVMMMVMPEAWQENPNMEAHKKAFYQYHANIMEPWDGPASVSFTDGKIVGATLDRNGLRPSRYLVTTDDKLIMASETGVLKTDPAKVIKRGRLQPGKIFVADLEKGRIITDDEVKDGICKEFSYEEWIKEQSYINELPTVDVEETHLEGAKLLDYQQAFGYTAEDLKFVIAALADDGKEPLSAMGVDIPLPILSEQTQHISCYFKQIFAQVTNPPIDPIRERMVMSLMSFIGEDFNLLEATSKAAKKIRLEQPVLTNAQLAKLKGIKKEGYESIQIDILFDKKEHLKDALLRICNVAIEAVKSGNNILILSNKGIAADKVAIPSLLATGAVHHALIKAALRAQADIVVEGGDVFETHHIATLVGYGAAAVNPFLGFETIKGLQTASLVSQELSYDKLESNYIAGIGMGMLKIFSKMGISTFQSYQGAQIFEALGIDNEVIDVAFAGTASRIKGIKFEGLKEEALIKHNMAFPEVATEKTNKLEVGGVYQWKRRGEFHLFNPNSISFLQRSTKNDDYATYKKYAREINDQTKKAATLRGLLEFTGQVPISLAEVEPVENIYKRFATGAMSFGSISHEAHSTLAIAMNRIGGKSIW
jgi:glutamate synthase (NADPH/NADH) large chain